MSLSDFKESQIIKMFAETATVFFRADLDIYVIRVKLDSDTTAIALVAGDKEYVRTQKHA